ncbi:MAG: helix-turn-helix transcriptional regulator [Fibrobacteres bacterium]|nr:helix-turn-helix transcriptional regulator [Fibrobacterota bacterium]
MLLIICLISLIYCSDSSYSDLPLRDKATREWNFPWKVVSISNDNNFIHELKFDNGTVRLLPKSSSGPAKFPFHSDFWHQYSLKFDEPSPSMLMNLAFSSDRGTGNQDIFMETFVYSLSDSMSNLTIRFRPFADTLKDVIFKFPLSRHQWHTVETRYSFSSSDSLTIKIIVDNKSIQNITVPFVSQKEEIIFRFIPHNKLTSPVFINRFYISKQRQMAFPDSPILQNVSDSSSIFPEVICNTFSTNYDGEMLNAVDWRFYKAGDTIPLFASEDKDPTFFYKRRLPFEVDSGNYEWQVRYKNNFGNYSNFSARTALRWNRVKPPLFEIDSLYICKAGTVRKQTIINPGEWYDLHIQLVKDSIPWKHYGFTVVWLSGPGFILGHPGNKGGAFLPDKNYVVNVAQDSVRGQFITEFYEKANTGSFQSHLVKMGEMGQYVDGTAFTDAVDSLNRHIKIRFRLFDSAVKGTWTINAYVNASAQIYYTNKREIRSSVYRTFITVDKPVNFNFKRIITTIISVILVAVALFVFLRRKTPTAELQIESREKKDFDRVVSFIKDHIKDEDINVTMIRTALNFSNPYYYKVLKAGNEENLPKLINKIRIERAIEILADPNKSISETGYEVGFSDSRYFGKVFKEYTGKTPTEFRTAKTN